MTPEMLHKIENPNIITILFQKMPCLFQDFSLRVGADNITVHLHDIRHDETSGFHTSGPTKDQGVDVLTLRIHGYFYLVRKEDILSIKIIPAPSFFLLKCFFPLVTEQISLTYLMKALFPFLPVTPASSCLKLPSESIR